MTTKAGFARSTTLTIAILLLVIAVSAYLIFLKFSSKPRVSEPEGAARTTTALPAGSTATSSPGGESQTKPSPAKPTPKQAAPVDCKTDLNCFTTALRECRPAKLRSTVTLDIGILQTTTSEFEIHGFTGDECQIQPRILDAFATLPDDYVSEQKARGVSHEDLQARLQRTNEALKEVIGLTRVCRVEKNELPKVADSFKEPADGFHLEISSRALSPTDCFLIPGADR